MKRRRINIDSLNLKRAKFGLDPSARSCLAREILVSGFLLLVFASSSHPQVESLDDFHT